MRSDSDSPTAGTGAPHDDGVPRNDGGDDWQPPSWEQVVAEHSARVYRLALRLTGNPHDAEDLTQDVFIRVFRSLDRYRPGTFEGWLHRITTNLFLDHARRKQRIRFDAMAEHVEERLETRQLGPVETVMAGDLDHDVSDALSALQPEYRVAVVLCDIEGLSYEEISDVLGIKLGTVRSRIHRGRAQLRKALVHRAPEAGGRYRGIAVEQGEAVSGGGVSGAGGREGGR
ncbi:RNA polymerase sigma factor SigE [Propionibacteriaceae bacterium Y2011]